MRPTTPISPAIRFVCSSMVFSSSGDKVMGGSTQALSPEWMPASSICSMIPATTVSVPSLRASTSTSMASSRNLSIRIGCPGETRSARSMNWRSVSDRKQSPWTARPGHKRAGRQRGSRSARRRQPPRRRSWPCRCSAGSGGDARRFPESVSGLPPGRWRRGRFPEWSPRPLPGPWPDSGGSGRRTGR